MTEADKAYAAAVREIARVREAGKSVLGLGGWRLRALDHLPPEIAGLTALKTLALNNTPVSDLTLIASLSALEALHLVNTQVSDLTPIAGLSALEALDLRDTQVSDLSPISNLTALKNLLLDDTPVSDLTPIAGLTALKTLTLTDTQVSDLRPIADLSALGTSGFGLHFVNTPFADATEDTRRLAAIAGNEQRTRETLAFLKTLPPWPEPLPWEVDAAQRDAPPADPALPLRVTDAGIALDTQPISPDEQTDPVRASLHDVLSQHAQDLLRISANQDEAAYRVACDLRDLLETGLASMDPLRVHLVVEQLRRIHAAAPQGTDRDLVLAMAAVIETGPALTLDTAPVNAFIDRIKRNRLERHDAAEVEAEIRLANSIAQSDASAPDVKALAEKTSASDVDDQFTHLRPTLNRNYVVALGKFVLSPVQNGIAGFVAIEALKLLSVNAADILLAAQAWGGPFAAWIAPILDRAQQMVDGAKYLSDKARKPRDKP